jgi:predicted NUDIX family NTP pyrophosphohydrolase
MFRHAAGRLEVLLAHMGGPFWASKDAGAWTLPKGEIEDGEVPAEAARREFAEETGHRVDGPMLPLGEIVQKSGKVVHAWAVEGDFDPARLVSATCTIEWPRGSGRQLEIPEIDRAAWFTLDDARALVVSGQAAFLDRLAALR